MAKFSLLVLFPKWKQLEKPVVLSRCCSAMGRVCGMDGELLGNEAVGKGVSADCECRMEYIGFVICEKCMDEINKRLG